MTTSSSDNETSNRSAFGEAFVEALESRDLKRNQIAASLGISASYISQTISGTKTVSAAWADLVADVMKLPPAERVKLHRAAAKDQGFKLDLDLTKP